MISINRIWIAVSVLCFTAFVDGLSFDEWIMREGKEYGSKKEYFKRQQIFKQNSLLIETFNKQNHTYTMGFTPFVDMTADEFRSYVRTSSPFRGLSILKTKTSSSVIRSLPTAVDWETKGFVSPVKNTQCSPVVDELSGAVESAAAILAGKLTLVDENQLSCAGCGCSCQLDGLCPYLKKKGMTYTFQTNQCNFRPTINVTACTTVQPNNETILMEYLSKQPVMVGVEADSSSFQMYSGGVLTDTSCGSNIDHVLLAVGYGTDNSIDYYRARNSWGETWGEKGYIRIGRGSKYPPAGECGIQSYVTVPTVILNP